MPHFKPGRLQAHCELVSSSPSSSQQQQQQRVSHMGPLTSLAVTKPSTQQKFFGSAFPVAWAVSNGSGKVDVFVCSEPTLSSTCSLLRSSMDAANIGSEARFTVTIGGEPKGCKDFAMHSQKCKHYIFLFSFSMYTILLADIGVLLETCELQMWSPIFSSTKRSHWMI